MFGYDTRPAFRWGMFERALLTIVLLILSALLLTVTIAVLSEHSDAGAELARDLELMSSFFFGMIVFALLGRPVGYLLSQLARRGYSRVVAN